MANSPEQQPNPESSVEATEAAGERLEQLLKNAETTPETSEKNKEKNIETAKKAAFETAISKEKGSAEKAKPKPSRRHGVVSKKEKEASFKRRIATVQSQLPTSQRAFSKLIHNKAVEKTSEAVGNTVARPNAILYGAVFAFFLVLAVYVLAKYSGYVLSGFETIGAFIIGWVLGVVYDYVRLLIIGRR